MRPEGESGGAVADVWISGHAAICAVGDTSAECFESLVTGRTGLGPLVAFPVERFGVTAAYQLADPPRTERERGLASATVGRAIRAAVAQAGLTSLEGVPVLVGTGLGETRTVESAWLSGDRIDEQDCALVRGVADACGATDVQVFSNACSASLYALAAGYDLVADGVVPAVVVAGVDVLSQSMFGLLDRVHLKSPHSVQPFDAERRGVIMGDGAAAVVLTAQRPDPQASSGAVCRLAAVSLGCDAFHPTAPDPDGIARTIRAAHRSAGIDAARVDAVYAHGTGTVLNDRAEAQALAQVMAPGVPIASVKGATGHTSGASGLFGVCMAVESFAAQVLPGTHGLATLDDAASGLAISAVPTALPAPDTIQVNAFGFGGLNAVAVLRGADSADTRRVSTPEPARPDLVRTGPVLHTPAGDAAVLAAVPCFPESGVLGWPGADEGDSEDPLDLLGILGRKGFRDMTQASRAAMAAALRATHEAGWPTATPLGDPSRAEAGSRLGIVAASCHGNTELVCTTAALIDQEGVRAASALDLPNASRNVLAARVAIRLGVTGPCLTIDSGPRGGWDALSWSVRLLASGRCDSVLCLAAEAPAETVARLTGARLVHGAVALVLGRSADARSSATPRTVGDPVAAYPLWAAGDPGALRGPLDALVGLHAVTGGAAGAVTIDGPTGGWGVRAA